MTESDGLTGSPIPRPWAVRLSARPKDELKAFGAWFQGAIPGRLERLAQAVRNSAGFENWSPTKSVESLARVGAWFSAQVESRPLTVEEIAEIELENRLTFTVSIPEKELTDRTCALAMDLGMYFGEVLIRNVSGTRWDQALQRKNDADYGRPIIRGRGQARLNPVRVLEVVATRISDGETADLGELYEIWAKSLRSYT